MSNKMYKVWKNGKIVLSPYPALYAGITTQKVFGRLDCSGGRLAKNKNRVFFYFWEDAIEAGFRPCKNCKPKEFRRANCDHMPFGLTGGMALAVKQTQKGNIRVCCELCNKFLGYARKGKNGLVYWQDGLIIPHEKFETIMT